VSLLSFGSARHDIVKISMHTPHHVCFTALAGHPQEKTIAAVIDSNVRAQRSLLNLAM
jgi:hypothetical protein